MERKLFAPVIADTSGFELVSKQKLQLRIESGDGSWFGCSRISPLRITCLTDEAQILREGETVSLSLRFLPTGDSIQSIKARIERLEQDGVVTGIVFRLEDDSRTRQYIGSILKHLLFSNGIASTGKREPFVEKITDEGCIRQIICALIANASRGFGRLRDDAISMVSLRATRVVSGSDLSIHWETEFPLPDPLAEIIITSHNSIYVIPVENCEWLDNALKTAFPTELVRQRVRLMRRIDTSDITIRFHHPCYPENHIHRKVTNISQYGIAFETELDTDLLFPALELPAFVVSVGERSILLQGVVRHVSLSKATGKSVCGVELDPQSPFHSRMGWAHILEPHLHPTTRRGSAETLDELWQLLDQSGYFRLSGKSPEDFEPLRAAYTQVSQYYSEGPELGCQVLWYSRFGLEATISISRMYTGTWLLYQLARLRRDPSEVPGRQILKDVYVHAFEHSKWYPSFNWVLVYTEANVRWHHLTHQAFAELHAESEKVFNIPFRLMEDSSKATKDELASVYDIGEATVSELSMLIEHMREIFPPAVVDALDFVPSRFFLQGFNRTLASANMYRDRHVFSVRRNGDTLAMAICETSTRGMHLFRLSDGVRLFALTDNAENAILSLMAYVRRFYIARENSVAIYYMEQSQVALGKKAGLTDLGQGNMWLIHSSLVDDFLEHIHRFAATRDTLPLSSTVPGNF